MQRRNLLHFYCIINRGRYYGNNRTDVQRKPADSSEIQGTAHKRAGEGNTALSENN